MTFLFHKTSRKQSFLHDLKVQAKVLRDHCLHASGFIWL